MSNAISGLRYQYVTIASLDGSKKIDLTNSILEMNYYEDILSPCITMTIVMENTHSIFNGLPIRGGESVAMQIETASKAGKASALKRALNKESTGVEQALNGRSTDVQLTMNHEPITNNHIKESKDSLSAGLPTCPHQDILNLYKKHLPQLAQPRVWDGVRQTNLRQRWLQAAKPSVFSPQGYASQADGLTWWDSFFAYIANDTKLAQGFETKDRTWRPDLVWIVNATNFAKIIDGKYQK
jgi:hypothetical protein